MSTLVTKDGSTYENPTKEVLAETRFGILWDGNPNSSKVISLYPWTIIETGHTKSRVYYSLRDLRGQFRTLDYGRYQPAIEYPSWNAFDAHEKTETLDHLTAELQRVRSENDDLHEKIKENRRLLRKIFEINEKGGHGSRKKVSELIRNEGILPRDHEVEED